MSRRALNRDGLKANSGRSDQPLGRARRMDGGWTSENEGGMDFKSRPWGRKIAMSLPIRPDLPRGTFTRGVSIAGADDKAVAWAKTGAASIKRDKIDKTIRR